MSKESFEQHKNIKNQPDYYGSEETVESFWKKMQIEKEKRLCEKHKPTLEEKKIVEILSAPLKKEKKELESQLTKAVSKKEEIKIRAKIIALIQKLKHIENPEQMSADDIKKLLIETDTELEKCKKSKSKDDLSRVSFLEEKEDFLLDQLSKRLK